MVTHNQWVGKHCPNSVVAYPVIRVNLCCWQVGQHQELVRGNPFCCDHRILYLCHIATQLRDSASTRPNEHSLISTGSHAVSLRIEASEVNECTLLGRNMRYKNPHTFCTHFHRFTQKSLSKFY